MSPLIIVTTTVETDDQAGQIATMLVENGLAACVQIDAAINSVYSWQGNIERSREMRLVIKSTHARWSELREKILAIHPYDEPQLLMWHVADAADGYAAWVRQQVKGSA